MHLMTRNRNGFKQNRNSSISRQKLTQIQDLDSNPLWILSVRAWMRIFSISISMSIYWIKIMKVGMFNIQVEQIA